MSQLRSISFPSRVHPNAARVDDALSKLRLDCSSGHVSSSLFGLDELYVCLDEFLNLHSTQHSLSQEINTRQAVDDILESSVKILDICGISRDLAAEIKEHARRLLSSIRRRKGDYSSVADYAKFRKKTKKDAKRMTSALKQVIRRVHIDDQDSSSESDRAAVRVLREANLWSCHVLKSLLLFLSGSTSSKTRQSKWSRVSRFVRKVDCEEKEDEVNEWTTVDLGLTKLWRCKNDGSDDAEKTHRTVQKQLEALEMRIGSIEDGLDCIFRRFIKSRASLLNIISQ